MHPLGRSARRCPGGVEAWLLGVSSGRGGGRWSRWSSGRRSGGCTSSAGVSIKEIARRTGRDRNTVRRALRVERAAELSAGAGGRRSSIRFGRRSTGCCREDPKLPGQRVRELIEPLGYRGLARRSWMTICARCGRCSRRRRGRFSARSIGRARSASSISGSRGAGRGRARSSSAAAGSSSRAWATRARAPARWSSPRRRRICSGASRAVCGRWAGCRRRWSGIARPACTRRGGRPTDEFAALCGQLRVGWRFCEPADPQAKGVVERLQGYLETNFEPRPRVRQRARLPAPARRLVRRRPTRARTRRCAAGRSTG